MYSDTASATDKKNNKKGHLLAPFDRVIKPGLFFAAAVFIFEFAYTASRIKHFLLAGIKRVALGTYFDIQVMTQGRTRFKCIATGAGYLHRAVSWMCVFLHCLVTPPFSVFLPGCWKRARIIANFEKNSSTQMFDAMYLSGLPFHGAKELCIIFRCLHFIYHKYDRFNIIHRV